MGFDIKGKEAAQRTASQVLFRNTSKYLVTVSAVHLSGCTSGTAQRDSGAGRWGGYIWLCRFCSQGISWRSLPNPGGICCCWGTRPAAASGCSSASPSLGTAMERLLMETGGGRLWFATATWAKRSPLRAPFQRPAMVCRHMKSLWSGETYGISANPLVHPSIQGRFWDSMWEK